MRRYMVILNLADDQEIAYSFEAISSNHALEQFFDAALEELKDAAVVEGPY